MTVGNIEGVAANNDTSALNTLVSILGQFVQSKQNAPAVSKINNVVSSSSTKQKSVTFTPQGIQSLSLLSSAAIN